MPLHTDLSARIDQLWVYPVKSCGGVAVPQAELTSTGLRWDRHWMVVDAEGMFVTQRELPRMVLIQPSLSETACVLAAPGMPPLVLPFDAPGLRISVEVWGDTVLAIDVGEAAAVWFSGFLSDEAPDALKRLRLVRFDPAVVRSCSSKWTGGRAASTQFADGFGVLVASSASLEGINQRLVGAGHLPVTMNRFRPNVVLGGVEPHDEDRIGEWRVATDSGEVILDNVKPCSRCPIPNIDPATAIASNDVGDALQAYRQDRRLDGAVTFGMNAIVLAGEGQVLSVGQAVGANWQFD